MKLAIPSESDSCLSSTRSGHFGHTPYFTIVEYDKDMNIVGAEAVKKLLMDVDLEAAARDLGAGPVKTFFTVTLPQILPGVLSGAMLAFAMSMDDCVSSFFVTGSNVNPLPLVIYSSVKTGVSPQVNALCTLMLLVVFAALGLYALLRRVTRKKA